MTTKTQKSKIYYYENEWEDKLPKLNYNRYFDLANKRVKIIHATGPIHIHLTLMFQDFAETLQGTFDEKK